MVYIGNFWHKSADKSSLEDQDKQQISFLVIHFTVKHSDWLVAPSSASSRLLMPEGFAMMMMMMICPPVTAAS